MCSHLQRVESTARIAGVIKKRTVENNEYAFVRDGTPIVLDRVFPEKVYASAITEAESRNMLPESGKHG